MSGPASLVERQRFLNLLEAFAGESHRRLLRASGDQEAWETARRFLDRQGFDLAQLDLVPVGLFLDCPTMQESLRLAGFTPSEIEASELAADPRLAGRLVGPIRDLDGSIRSFWARHPVPKRPQYLFKGRWKEDVPAFGLDVAFPALDDGRLPLVLIEGLLDVLLLQFHGFLHVAAIGGDGTHLTRRRWEKLAHLGVRRAILVLRPDEIGLRGAAAAQANARGARLAPDVSVLPPERLEGFASPGEFVRARGISAFRALFEPRVELPPAEPHPPAEKSPPKALVADGCPRPGFCALHRCDETDCFCFD